jgi:hypothetical protein
MAQSIADGPSVWITECRIGEPAQDDGARGYWILALEAVLGATESRGVLGERPMRTRKQDVDR